jgi:regulator of nucleoside diphosphate kinase
MDVLDMYVTQYDLARLKDVLHVGMSASGRDRDMFAILQREVDRAHIVESTAVPHDVVTMNSRVRLRDLETNSEMTYTVVFPSEADLEQGKISVLAPIGTAILGFRVGDRVTWQVPGGVRNLRIEEIMYQPEAAGEYAV